MVDSGGIKAVNKNSDNKHRKLIVVDRVRSQEEKKKQPKIVPEQFIEEEKVGEVIQRTKNVPVSKKHLHLDWGTFWVPSLRKILVLILDTPCIVSQCVRLVSQGRSCQQQKFK